jgi:hypothetical protein
MVSQLPSMKSTLTVILLVVSNALRLGSLLLVTSGLHVAFLLPAWSVAGGRCRVLTCTAHSLERCKKNVYGRIHMAGALYSELHPACALYDADVGGHLT